MTRTFKKGERYQAKAYQCYLEPAVLALAHAAPEQGRFAELLETMLKRDLTTTCAAALQAMALQKIDARKYQWRIAQEDPRLEVRRGVFERARQLFGKEAKPLLERYAPVDAEAKRVLAEPGE